MPKLYFRNVNTGKRYEVVKLDKAAGKVTLKGATATFDEVYDKDRFKRMGYVLEQGTEDAVK